MFSVAVVKKINLSRLFRTLIFLKSLFVLAACALNPGAAEFLAYRQAFEETRSASKSLFEVLEIAERKQEIIVAKRTLKGEFDPNSTYLYTDLADPPLTNEYKLSFDAVSRYNQVMVALVTGEQAKTVSDDLQALATAIISLPADITGTSKFKSAKAFVPILGTIAEYSLATRNRRIFAEELADNSQPVIDLMLAMRNGSGTVFKFIRTSSSKEKAEIEKLVADWVVLMDRNIAAFQQAQSAAQNPRIGASDLLALQARIQEISEAAKSVQEGLARISS